MLVEEYAARLGAVLGVLMIASYEYVPSWMKVPALCLVFAVWLRVLWLLIARQL